MARSSWAWARKNDRQTATSTSVGRSIVDLSGEPITTGIVGPRTIEDVPIRRTSADASVTEELVRAALATVIDPDIRRPITELGMVESIAIGKSGLVGVGILLTVPGCPLKEKIKADVTAAVMTVAGVTGVDVTLGFMTDEQRKALQVQLRGPGKPEKEIPFNDPNS